MLLVNGSFDLGTALILLIFIVNAPTIAFLIEFPIEKICKFFDRRFKR